MNISLSDTTQRLLEARMKTGAYASPDDALRVALETMEQLENDELDDETFAAIEEGLAQAKRGECRPWEQVRAELRDKYGLK